MTMFPTVRFHAARKLIFGPLALVLAGALVLVGCDTTDVTDDQIASVVISPDSASIDVGDQIDFDVAALNASGEPIEDHNLSIRWWSTDETVFTVNDDGLAIGEDSGKAFCMVEATDEVAGKIAGNTATSSLRRFTGRDSAYVVVLK